MDGLSARWNIPCHRTDELLLSYCSRLCNMSGVVTPRRVMMELFGVTGIALGSGLPGHLGHLETKLVPIAFPSFDVLLRKTTHFRYYAHFLDQPRQAELAYHMRVDGAAKACLGLLASRIGAGLELRLCPKCAAAELQSFGSAYWHSTHHLPGVSVCHYDGHVLIRQRTARATLSLELPTGDPGLAYAQSTPRVALQFAKWSAALLAVDDRPSPDFLRDLYWSRLRERGFAHGRLRIADDRLACRVRAAFNNFHFLEQIRSINIAAVRSLQWLPKLYRSPRGAQHPIYHLMLLMFLFECPDHYFAALRKNILAIPSPSKSEPLLQTSVWESTMAQALVSGHSVTAASRAAGVSTTTGTVIARRLGWCFIERAKRIDQHTRGRIIRSLGQGVTVAQVAVQEGLSEASVRRIRLAVRGLKGLQSRRRIAHERLRRRRALNGLLRNRSSITATDLYIRSPSLYSWLRRHDNNWLHERLSPMKRERAPFATWLWSQRDLTLSKQLRSACLALLATSGRPRQITLSRLARMTESRRWLEKQLERLPRCATVLRAFAESNQAFRIRRLQWSLRDLRSKGQQVSFSVVMRNAHIRHEWAAELRPVFEELTRDGQGGEERIA